MFVLPLMLNYAVDIYNLKFLSFDYFFSFSVTTATKCNFLHVYLCVCAQRRAVSVCRCTEVNIRYHHSSVMSTCNFF